MRVFNLLLGALLVVAVAGQREQCLATGDSTACEACFDSETISEEVSEQCLNCANGSAPYQCVACLSYAITDWVKIGSCPVSLPLHRTTSCELPAAQLLSQSTLSKADIVLVFLIELLECLARLVENHPIRMLVLPA